VTVWVEVLVDIIIKAVRRANMAIIEAGNENPDLKGMGSTATVLLISEESAHVAHVGDSRVYQFRGKRKIFRTYDHSMVFDLVKQKVITEEQARLSAQSNVITRALGMKPDVEVEVHELPFKKGDRFVLCSDGIHGTMPEAELVKMVTLTGSIGTITDNISTYVDNLGHSSGGGHDNLTIAIVETTINSKLKAKMSKKAKLTILVLAVICVLSIILNIVLATNRYNSTPAENGLYVQPHSTQKSSDDIYTGNAGEIVNQKIDSTKTK